MVSSGFTNLQDEFKMNSGTGTDALGRVFPRGTVLDPATTRQVAAGAVDPVSGLVNKSTAAVFVRDPFYNNGGNTSVAGITNFTGLTANMNMIPANRIDSNAVNLLGVFPAQNITTSNFNNNFSWTPKEPQDTNSYDIRIDQNFNANNILFGVFDRSLISYTVPSSPCLEWPSVKLEEGMTASLRMPLPSDTPTSLLRRSQTKCTSAWFMLTNCSSRSTETPSGFPASTEFWEFRR